MRKLTNPSTKVWSSLSQRPALDPKSLMQTVQNTYDTVAKGGDTALLELTEKYDGVKLRKINLPISDQTNEVQDLEPELRTAIDLAYDNILTFHASQVVEQQKIETMPGVICWREARPIESVGLYIPGGTAPLISTLLMLGIPAKLAGCTEIIVCTPPGKDGSINMAIRYVAAKLGLKTIYAVGGAQAIAAMVVGTQSIPRVSKVFGPGNQYVTAAKQMAERFGVAIDMPAGPSEVLVIADETARADFVAADLLSQAEHGIDSQVVLLTTSQKVRREVQFELEKQIARLPRRAIASQALQKSLDIFFDSVETAVAFANEYAPEHIILQVEKAEEWAKSVNNAGSVFVGAFTPESAGDYASGTNHTLPTGGWAKSYAGVSLASFQRMVTFQSISQAGLSDLAQAIVPLAQAEGLQAHAKAVTIRTTLNS